MKFYGLVNNENKIWVGNLTTTAILKSGKFKDQDKISVKDFKYLNESVELATSSLVIFKSFAARGIHDSRYTEKEKTKFKEFIKKLNSCKIKEIKIKVFVE